MAKANQVQERDYRLLIQLTVKARMGWEFVGHTDPYKAMGRLEAAGYVESFDGPQPLPTFKGQAPRKPDTFYRLTDMGRAEAQTQASQFPHLVHLAAK